MRLAILTLDWKLPKNRKYARREFCKALRKLGIQVDAEYVEVRSPLLNKYTFESPTARKWHKDDRGSKGLSLIVWSDKYPTLLRERRSKRQIVIPSGSIVIFNNDYYRHKPDHKGKNSRRWFIRYAIYSKELPTKPKYPVWMISNAKR